MPPGRQTHLPPHPLHPNHNTNLPPPLPHNPRLLRRLQRPRLPLRLRPAILLPSRHLPPPLPPHHQRDPPLYLQRQFPHLARKTPQVGAVAYTRILGHRE